MRCIVTSARLIGFGVSTLQQIMQAEVTKTCNPNTFIAPQNASIAFQDPSAIAFVGPFAVD